MKSRAMKKIVALVIIAALAVTMAVTLAACNDSDSAGRIAIVVPSADHGWTNGIMTNAQNYAKDVNANTEYEAVVITADNATTMNQQLEDIAANKNYDAVVVLPHDNTVQPGVLALANAGIPYIMVDRIIAAAEEQALATVMGNNEMIGELTAQHFYDQGMRLGDKILIMPGDNSSVPEMRNDGFYSKLRELGWTDAQLQTVDKGGTIYQTDFTGWSRQKGQELFTSFVQSQNYQEYKWIFTHDDEIAIGIMNALRTDLAAQRDSILNGTVHLAASSGLNEIYQIMREEHQYAEFNEYFTKLAKMKDSDTPDLISVTYPPSMINDALDLMMDYLAGEKIADLVVPVEVISADNVGDMVGFN